MTLVGWAPRIAWTIALCAVCAAVVVVVPRSVGGQQRVDCSTYDFDAQRWQDTATQPQGPRRGLFGDLARCRLLVGKNRAEVRELLGTPTANGGRQWAYYLAQCGIDTCRGYVNFGNDGRVVHAFQGDG